MKYIKNILIASLCSIGLSGCGAFEVVNEETRLDSLSNIYNFSWHYHTEMEKDGVKRIYDGDGFITNSDAMTVESNYKAEGETLDDASFWKNYIILDKDTHQYLHYSYIVYPDGSTKTKDDEHYLSDEELAESVKNYIVSNQPLFKEVITENNKVGENSYLLENPTSDFWFAKSGVFMTAHQINSIKLTFDKNALTKIDYVNDTGREVNVHIFDIGTTTVSL